MDPVSLPLYSGIAGVELGLNHIRHSFIAYGKHRDMVLVRTRGRRAFRVLQPRMCGAQYNRVRHGVIEFCSCHIRTFRVTDGAFLKQLWP